MFVQETIKIDMDNVDLSNKELAKISYFKNHNSQRLINKLIFVNTLIENIEKYLVKNINMIDLQYLYHDIWTHKPTNTDLEFLEFKKQFTNDGDLEIIKWIFATYKTLQPYFVKES